MVFFFKKPTTLLEQQRKQQILILLFVGVIFVTSIVLWLGLFRKKPQAMLPATPIIQAKSIEVDFGFFEDNLFKSLAEPPLLPSTPEKPGRGNPFLPLEK